MLYSHADLVDGGVYRAKLPMHGHVTALVKLEVFNGKYIFWECDWDARKQDYVLNPQQSKSFHFTAQALDALIAMGLIFD